MYGFSSQALGRFLAELINLGMFPERELMNVPETASWQNIEDIWVWTSHPAATDAMLPCAREIRRAFGINQPETGFVYEVSALIGQGTGFSLVIRWEQLVST